MNPLFVKTSGNIKGEPLVMLHGWGMNSGAWESIREELEADFFMHWVDLPGYGLNRDIIANNMDDIVDLILASIPKNSHLVGWSLGGLVAQAMAQKSHINSFVRFKSLTLIASSLKFSQSKGWEHATTLENLNNFSENLKNDIEGTLKRFVSLQFMGLKGAKDIQKALMNGIIVKQQAEDQQYKSGKKRGGGLLNDKSTPNFDVLNLGLEILKTADYRKNTQKVPQHWIFAGRDRLIPPLVINDLKYLRPDDQITLLDNAGHAPFMTHPKEFLASLRPFIKNHA